MNVLKELALLKVPSLVPERSDAESEDRVVELFRNRAELKKAYSEVQSEIHRLKDRLKQQEGATRRVQEMLEVLEGRLAGTETAYPAIVFYHLRGLWQLGRELIEQLVADLARQNEERERKLHLAEFNRRQFAKRQAVDLQLRDAEAQCAEERHRLFELERRRAALTRFWHYFTRREVDAQLVIVRRAAEAAESALSDARAAAEELDATAAGEFPGLSVEARRAINLAAIAYAEVLCRRLARTPLVQLAREAVGRREATDDYGSRPQCEAHIAEIARARALLQNRAGVPEEIRARLDALRKAVRYRSADDPLPMPESLGTPDAEADEAPPGTSAGAAGAANAAAPALPNVLEEDTWDLFRIVLR